MNESLNRMRSAADAWSAEGDRRCIFVEAYATMTERMLASMEGFDDPAWVGTLLSRFADYYFLAVRQFEVGDPSLAPAWRVAFETCGSGEPSVLQHLFLGINAHINHDLAFAVADLLGSEEDVVTRHGDYLSVNRVIDDTIDLVQATVVAPQSRLLELADRLCGPVDEWVFSRLITGWRNDVWTHACDIALGDPSARTAAADRVSREAMERAQLIARIGSV